MGQIARGRSSAGGRRPGLRHWPWLALLLALGACEGRYIELSEPRPREVVTGSAAGPGELVVPTQRPLAGPAPAFLGRPHDEILTAISGARPIGGRGTSGVSLSMYVNLEGPDDAAFKPRTRVGQRWNGEIAAFRLGRLLGIDRVPPALTRRVRPALIQGLLSDEPETLARFNEEAVIDGEGMASGAFIYWVPEIHPAEVSRLENLDDWTGWLRQGAAIPPERLELAHQLSDSIVFDYVTGNWDRWSGGNAFYGPDGRTLILLDNNAAFGTEFSDRLRRRLEAPLVQVERFSATLYHRLIGLSAEDIEAELAADPTGVDLLTGEQIARVLERRDQVLQRIEALADRHGHDAVLCFP